MYSLILEKFYQITPTKATIEVNQFSLQQKQQPVNFSHKVQTDHSWFSHELFIFNKNQPDRSKPPCVHTRQVYGLCRLN